MIRRSDALAFRNSLRDAMGEGKEAAIEATAARQERTIDGILDRLYAPEDARRREMVLLADEVGLGKTFVALGVAFAVLEQQRALKRRRRHVLVVTPTSHALFGKWIREAERFFRMVVPEGQGVRVRAAENPADLARILRERGPFLVIARMSAIAGRLHSYERARLAILHSLLHTKGFRLAPSKRSRLLESLKMDEGPESLDLRRSKAAWSAAQEDDDLGFAHLEFRKAWRRMERTDGPLCDRIRDSWQRVREGRAPRAALKDEIREVCRGALAQTMPRNLPLVVVDEIHNWKNHPETWWRFLHMFGLRVDRLLGLSATPFQLGPQELTQVLHLRRCLALTEERAAFLTAEVAALGADLQSAGSAGAALRDAWADVTAEDNEALESAWSKRADGQALVGVPPRLVRAVEAAAAVRESHARLEATLRPFLVRHRRDVNHRAWWVGRESTPTATEPSARGSALRWRPGLDVRGDAELVHYLMMRAVQEQKEGRGSAGLGADLGGSYAFFREGELARMLPGRTEEAARYLSLVQRAVGGESHEHPKVAVTAERAYQAWLRGEKTLVFCFNVRTVDAVRDAVRLRIEARSTEVLTAALGCTPGELDLRVKNLQKRLYNYRQSVFLLFQDHPLAGRLGQVAGPLALGSEGLEELAVHLARSGPPRDRGRFDRRRVLASVERILVARWSATAEGREWLDQVLGPWQLADSTAAAVELISAPDWVVRRRVYVEGVLREAEGEALPDDEEMAVLGADARPEDCAAWREVLAGQAGQAVLAPYLGRRDVEVPCLLTRWHAAALAELPWQLRALAARMLRRIVRSPGFLARFILDDPSARPDPEAESSDDQWTALIHRRYQSPPANSESARDRFAAYLATLQKAVGLEEQIRAYEDASRNREVVTRVTGGVKGSERDRLFTGFNTPLVPEVLIVTTVGQEGIDLHRECRHVIHHDLPWNPATLEQRTGRVDRIGSKAERVHGSGNGDGSLDVVVPYLAGTYDEHRFRVVHGRAHIFEVTMGGDYAVDGHRVQKDAMEEGLREDDAGEDGGAWVPIPESIAKDLRLDLEARP